VSIGVDGSAGDCGWRIGAWALVQGVGLMMAALAAVAVSYLGCLGGQSMVWIQNLLPSGRQASWKRCLCPPADCKPLHESFSLAAIIHPPAGPQTLLCGEHHFVKWTVCE